MRRVTLAQSRVRPLSIHAWTELVRCMAGSIYDVALDLRPPEIIAPDAGFPDVELMDLEAFADY